MLCFLKLIEYIINRPNFFLPMPFFSKDRLYYGHKYETSLQTNYQHTIKQTNYLSYIQIIARHMVILFIALLQISMAAFTLPFATASINKHGVAFKDAPCNANTVIDFAFSPNSVLTFSTDSTSTASYSTLRYLDILGYEQTYTLANAQVVSQTYLLGFNKAFLFQFKSGGNTVFFSVPFLDNGNPTNQIRQTIYMSNQTDSLLSGLSSISNTTTNISLSSFNAFNDLTYSKFYSIMDTTNKITLLIAKIHFKYDYTIPTTSSASIFNASNYTFNSQSTGDVLCWGSQYSYGFFQTHMRESVPLWTILIFTLFFWLLILLSAEVTPEVYQRSFVNNKWTSWSMYSLFWLSHEEWFTRTSRSSLLLINFFWQCLVLSAIYNQQGTTVGTPIIIWSAVIAYIVSLPMPYILGKVFFQRIYSIEIQKFNTKRQMHLQTNKQKHEQLQKSVILKEQHISGIYYFFYSMCIITFILFSALSVHLMHQFPRDYYYLNWHWLASAWITFALDHLIVDPIMTACFGNRSWYQVRGYYYNAQLGELSRKVD